MFELPMIRIDGKEYLERLQEGEFFMRSNLYYQSLDGKDAARSDPYDGAIPATKLAGFPFAEFGISGITNPRIMMGHTFVKCFFYYRRTDCHQIQDGVYILTMKTDTRKALAEFISSHALIILNPSQLVEQVNQECEKRALKLWYGEVEYLTDEELRKRKIGLLTRSCRKNPCFYKSADYQEQQEFRFCVRVPYKHISEVKTLNGIEYFTIDLEAKDETYTLNIGSLKNISCILPISEILNYPVLVDSNSKKVCFLREAKYEELEGLRD